VEAELPGVKKENLEVRVGDNGRSVTIEGRVYSRNSNAAPQTEQESSTPQAQAQAQSSESNVQSESTSTEGMHSISPSLF